MDLLNIIGQFLLLWLILYVVVFALQLLTTRKREIPRRRQTNSLLPTFSIIENETEVIERDQWSIKLFQIKYTTQHLNKHFSRLTKMAPRFWRLWFSLGAIIAAFLMVVGTGVILFAAIKILTSLSHLFQAREPHLTKRGLTEEDDQVFLPMIPGVTLPMSHIGYYLIALAVCGIFHEAGHAIAAYSQGIAIQSSGMFILYLYPGAFVNISDQSLQSLSPFRQLKIMCAGVWHNLVLYLFAFVSLAGGLKWMLLLLGWQSLEGLGGVSVVQIRANSPLAPHLPPSTVIYRLDDRPLVANIEDWNAHLFVTEGRHTLDQGFCVSQTEFAYDGYGTSCCDISDQYPFGRSENASIACFESFPVTGKPTDQNCLPTLQVLSSTDPARCSARSDCDYGMTCVVPYTPSITGQVVRIYARFPSWLNTDEKVFVFEGELVDIWESVKVSLLTPGYRFLPSSLPHMLEFILRYISSFTLALAVLNILPAFKLDGEYALEQFLILILQQPSDSQLTTRLDETRFIRKTHQSIVKCTSVVVGFVIVGSLFTGLLSNQAT